jgi:hypothetical protein
MRCPNARVDETGQEQPHTLLKTYNTLNASIILVDHETKMTVFSQLSSFGQRICIEGYTSLLVLHRKGHYEGGPTSARGLNLCEREKRTLAGAVGPLFHYKG